MEVLTQDLRTATSVTSASGTSVSFLAALADRRRDHRHLHPGGDRDPHETSVQPNVSVEEPPP